MRTYWNTNHTLRTLDEWAPDCWTQVTCPTPDDEDFLFNKLHVPDYFLDDIRDKDERSRYEYDEGWTLIILRIPYVKEVASRTPHTTIPLGIILNKGICITVCNYRLRGPRVPPFLLCRRVVLEEIEANQRAARRSQAQP